MRDLWGGVREGELDFYFGVSSVRRHLWRTGDGFWLTTSLVTR